MLFNRNIALEQAVTFSRFDTESVFSTVSAHPFLLDDRQWKTPEHYYQANKYQGTDYFDTVFMADNGQLAYDLGHRWWKRKANGWKKSRELYMTRALYRKVMEYPDVKQALLDTNDSLLVATSQYDYFWGIGRDLRGSNTLGKVWMGIREKIQSA